MRSMKISEVALIIIWHNYILSMTHPVQNQLILYSTRWKKMGILSLFREIFFELGMEFLRFQIWKSDWHYFDLSLMEMWKPLVVSLSLWINKPSREEQNIPGFYSVK